MSGQPAGQPNPQQAHPLHRSSSVVPLEENPGITAQEPSESLLPYSAGETLPSLPLSPSQPPPRPLPPPEHRHQPFTAPQPATSSSTHSASYLSSSAGPTAQTQDLCSRSGSPRRKFPAIAGTSGPFSTFKRARTSSPGSEGGPSTSAANSEMGDVESPGAHYSDHHSVAQGSRSQQEQENTELHPPAMSETGSSLGAMMDAKALRLSDATPPPDSAMASPSVSPLSPSIQTPTSPRVQRTIISDLMKKALKSGDSWYLVSGDWFNKWTAMCQENEQYTDAPFVPHANSVGPIENDDLIDQRTRGLRLDLDEGDSFVLVPSDAWELLVRWYGLTGQGIERKCILDPDGRTVKVEIYVPEVSFINMVASPAAGSEHTMPHVATVSRATPLLEVRKTAIEKLKLTVSSEADVRLWSLPDDLPLAAEVDMRKGLELEGTAPIEEPQLPEQLASLLTLPVGRVQPLGVEVRQDDGFWPSTVAKEQSNKASVRNIFAQTGGDSFSRLQNPSNVQPEPQTNSVAPRAMTTRSKTVNERGSGVVVGLKGLSNMGNTCFMNSALQCLSNTPELRDYFTSRVYEDEINRDNPLGNGGQLAQAFGILIQQLWSGSGTAFQPRDFKWSLARFAPQFSGYAQQDTQELLAFLLDGLHEDLNRIKKKPYIEAPDWQGGDLKAMVKFAKKQWEIYKARNDSVIVDLFQGQYRSTLVCPECSKVSIKFDPFMYLTLPMPSKTKWKHKVAFVPYDPTQSIKMINMTLPLEASISKVKQTIGDVAGVNPKKLLGAEPYHRKIWRYFYDYEPVHTIEKADVAIFWELPAEFSLTPPKLKGTHKTQYDPPPVHVQHVEYHSPPPDWEKDQYVVLPVFTVVANQAEPKGLPFFVSIPRIDVNDPIAIRREVVSQYRRYSSSPDKLVDIAEASGAASQATSPIVAAAAAAPIQTDDTSIGSWEVVSTQQRGLIEDMPVDTFAEITPSGDVIETSRSRSSSQEVAAVVGPSIIEEIVPAAPSRVEPFEIVYMVTAPGSPRPLPHEAQGFERAGEELFERAKRLGVAQSDTPSIPLVYSSGSLVCIWSQDAAAELLSGSPFDSEWGDAREEVDDPQTASDKLSSAQKRRGKDVLHIDDCLDEFTKEEKLGEEDPWYCPQCKDFRQATKKFDLWKVPDILVVHLKRFSSGRGLRDKIETVVDFPIEGLDLTDRVEAAKAVQQLKEEKAAARRDSAGSSDSDTSRGSSVSPTDPGEMATPQDLSASVLSAISEANDDAVTADKPIYDLFAVDNHFGGLGGGHYTASAKNDIDGKWHYFDDSHVRDIRDPDEIKSSAAYLLFYRRRTTRIIGGKSREIIKNARVKDEEATASGSGAPVVGQQEVGMDDDGDDTMKVSVEDYPGSFTGPSMPPLGLWRGNRVSSANALDSDDASENVRPSNRHRIRRLSWADDSPQMPGSFTYHDSPVAPVTPPEETGAASDEKDDTPPESFAGPYVSSVDLVAAQRRRQQRAQGDLWSDSDEEDDERSANRQGTTVGSEGDSISPHQLTRGGGRLPRYPIEADEDDDKYASLLPSSASVRGRGGGRHRLAVDEEEEDDEGIASDQAEADVSSSSSSDEGRGDGADAQSGGGNASDVEDSLPRSRRNSAMHPVDVGLQEQE